MNKKVRTRFAPSPTGYLHVGGVRTALYCWLYARHCDGEYLLRIEDTDRERSKPEYVDAIMEGLSWLGLMPDGELYYQSKRFDRYTEVLEQLKLNQQVYPCYCSKQRLQSLREQQRANGEKPRYDGRCRYGGVDADGVSPVYRFKNPLDGAVVFNDLVHGETRIENAELDDLIIARPDGTPTYNFTVVVDDIDMNITHVIRGDDHINNTPRQINIMNALGVELPEFAHIPMILGTDGKRYSKRHGASSVTEFKKMGLLPKALINYMVRLGWSHGDQEIFSINELIEKFDIADVNKSAATFDFDKLFWLNQQHIQQSDAQELIPLLKQNLAELGIHTSDDEKLAKVIEVQKTRVKDMIEMAQKSEFVFRAPSEYDEKAVAKFINSESLGHTQALMENLEKLADWEMASLDQVVRQHIADAGIKFPMLAQPLRIALTGSTVSPSIDQTLYLIGREDSLERLAQAIGAFST